MQYIIVQYIQYIIMQYIIVQYIQYIIMQYINAAASLLGRLDAQHFTNGIIRDLVPVELLAMVQQHTTT